MRTGLDPRSSNTSSSDAACSEACAGSGLAARSSTTSSKAGCLAATASASAAEACCGPCVMAPGCCTDVCAAGVTSSWLSCYTMKHTLDRLLRSLCAGCKNSCIIMNSSLPILPFADIDDYVVLYLKQSNGDIIGKLGLQSRNLDNWNGEEQVEQKEDGFSDTSQFLMLEEATRPSCDVPESWRQDEICAHGLQQRK